MQSIAQRISSRNQFFAVTGALAALGMYFTSCPAFSLEPADTAQITGDTPDPKQLTLKTMDLPVSAVDPGAMQVKLKVKIDGTIFQNNLAIMLNGKKIHEADDPTTGDFTADVILEGEKTPLEIVTITDKGDSKKFKFKITYADYNARVNPGSAAEEDPNKPHVSLGTIKPSVGLAYSSFSQFLVPQFNQLGLLLDLMWTKDSLFFDRGNAKFEVSYVNPLSITSVKPFYANDSLSVQVLDVNLLYGWSVFPKDRKYQLKAFGGIYFSTTSANLGLLGYQQILWPEVQVEGSYELTPTQKFVLEAQFAPSSSGFFQISPSSSLFLMRGSWLHPLSKSFTLDLKLGIKSLNYTGIYGAFNDTEDQFTAGMDIAL